MMWTNPHHPPLLTLPCKVLQYTSCMFMNYRCTAIKHLSFYSLSPDLCTRFHAITVALFATVLYLVLSGKAGKWERGRTVLQTVFALNILKCYVTHMWACVMCVSFCFVYSDPAGGLLFFLDFLPCFHLTSGFPVCVFMEFIRSLSTKIYLHDLKMYVGVPVRDKQ